MVRKALVAVLALTMCLSISVTTWAADTLTFSQSESSGTELTITNVIKQGEMTPDEVAQLWGMSKTRDHYVEDELVSLGYWVLGYNENEYYTARLKNDAKYIVYEATSPVKIEQTNGGSYGWGILSPSGNKHCFNYTGKLEGFSIDDPDVDYDADINVVMDTGYLQKGTYITIHTPGSYFITTAGMGNFRYGSINPDEGFILMVNYGANTIHITVDGQSVVFNDQDPVIIDGRTLVPVRGVFEQMGFEVKWYNDGSQAELVKADDKIIITIDSSTFTTNGVNHTLDVPAQLIGGRTMLPMRAVLESIGYSLDWDEVTQTVIISSEAIQEQSEVAVTPTPEPPITPITIPKPLPMPTEREVYERMVALKQEYPDGMRWTNDNYYKWNGGVYSAGYGCSGFAMILSDEAFGELPARKHTDFDKIRVGDILRINNDTHSVIILKIEETSITIAEGNYNSYIKWGRELTWEKVMSGDYVLTRYPE